MDPHCVARSSPPGLNGSHRVRLLLVISSLEHGGAERQVIHLANHLPTKDFDVHICSLSSLVPMAENLRNRGQLHVVEKTWRFDTSVVARVAQLMRELRIQIAHAFLFDAEIVTRLAARWAGVPVVVASERNTDYQHPLSHELALRLTRSFFDVMIANSSSGKQFNIRTLGLPANRIHVIHNGVDVTRFRPEDRTAARRKLDLPVDDHVIGMAASFKRQKRHGDFFKVAQALLGRFPNTWFLCAGEPLRDNQQGAEDYHREMRSLVENLRIKDRVRFVGKRDDMPTVFNACDVTMLTSSREGTPNVLLESMACGVPVIATDVADNAYVVPDGRVGYIVPLGDVDRMVDRAATLLGDPAHRAAMGHAARTWVEKEFSLTALVSKTATVYQNYLSKKLNRNVSPRQHEGPVCG
jgi:glycosyltransferase involved in cell wall biosynthesis